jgi:hypothetical protein
MDIKGAVEFLDEYFRDYVVYILRLFSKTNREDPPPSVADPQSKLMTYGLVSVVLGVLFQQLFIGGVNKTGEIDFLQAVTIELCFWLFVALLTQALLDLLGVREDFEKSLSAVLRVFPPAFLVGAYSAFGIYLFASPFRSHELDPSKYAAVTDAIVQCGLLAIFFPASLTMVVKTRIWRARLTAILVIAGVLLFNIFTIFNYGPPPSAKSDTVQNNSTAVGKPLLYSRIPPQAKTAGQQ